MKGHVATIAVLLATLAAELLAIRSGGLAGIALLVLVALIALGVISGLSLDDVGLVCTYGSALFIPLYGLGGHTRPGDLLLPLAVLAFLFSQSRRAWPHLPAWVWVLTATVLAVAALHEIAPTNSAYLGARTVVDAAGRLGSEPEHNASVAFRFLLAVFGVPLVCVWAAQRSPSAPRRIAFWFVIGSAFSALVALGTAYGFGGVTSALGATSIGSRQGGLSGHPNFLGAATALAFPFAMDLVLSGRTRDRLFGWPCAALLLGGVYVSGSRGAALSVVLAGLAYGLLQPRIRRQWAAVLLVLAGAVVVVFVLVPSLGSAVLQGTRLGAGAVGAAGSDIVRELVAQQGLRDFSYSPFDGVGLQVSAEAHNVYLQALAAGGLLLFVGYVIYVLGSLVTGFRLLRKHPLAGSTTASLIGAALYGGVENTLTYRFVYLPIGIVCALWYALRPRATAAEAEADVDATPDDDALTTV